MKSFYTAIFLSLATFLVLYAGLHIGSFRTDWQTLLAIFQAYDNTLPEHIAVVQLRLPRMLMALLVGGLLALSGYLLQILINNPLTDSYTLGTASGASLGINIAFLGIVPLSFSGFYLPIVAAFLGALLVTSLVVLIAKRSGGATAQLLLAGIAVSALANSTISLLSYMADGDGKMRNIIFWTLGSFESARWEYLPLLSIALFLGVLLFILFQKHLFVLMLGQNRARNLGLNVKLIHNILLITATMLTALAVAFAGTIGFVGLMMPHTARAWFGANHRYNAFWVSWAGGLFLMSCDVLARYLYQPAGLPIGIITSFVGIPFFVYLLLQKKSTF